MEIEKTEKQRHRSQRYRTTRLVTIAQIEGRVRDVGSESVWLSVTAQNVRQFQNAKTGPSVPCPI
jgi:hypothetical protein